MNTWFNIITVLYLIFIGATRYLFEARTSISVPWDTVYSRFPGMSVIGAMAIVCILVIWGSLIIRHFWNRFVVDVFQLRHISFNEAISICLIIMLVTT